MGRSLKSGLVGSLRPRPLDRAHDVVLGLVSISPACHLDPLAGFQVLIVLEEVLYLLDGDFRQVSVVVDLLIPSCQTRHGHRDDLFIAAGLVLHLQYPDWTYRKYRARNHSALVGNEHVAWVAILGKRVRNEPVVAGITHRGKIGRA